jgi:biopolymer transport protein ExbD
VYFYHLRIFQAVVEIPYNYFRARVEEMIDVISFLPVLFMVSTLAMAINRGLPVNPPIAATSQEDPRENLNLTLIQEGGIFLNRELIVLQDLEPRAKVALARESDLMVIINADREVRHHAVVEVMDEMRLAGVGRLAIAMRPGRKAKP